MMCRAPLVSHGVIGRRQSRKAYLGVSSAVASILSLLLLPGCPSVTIPDGDPPPERGLPTLTSISVTEGSSGFLIPAVRIEGSNLEDGTLTAMGGIRFGREVVSDVAIVFDIDLVDAVDGNYLITVTTERGTADIPFAVVTRVTIPVEAPNDITSASLFLNPPENLILPGLLDASPAVQQFVRELNDFWGLNVRVNAYIPGSPDGQGGTWPPNNALAIPGPEQQIVYDRRWFEGIEAQQGTDVFTKLVIAHEVGHQVQFNFVGINSLPPINGLIELMADCLAGIYMAAIGFAGDELAAAQTPLCGGPSVWLDPLPNAHGSCEERETAIRHGVELTEQNPTASAQTRIDTCVEVPPFGDNIPPRPGPEPGPEPGPQFTLGCIVVQNNQSFPVSILINGFYFGALLPFESGPIPNLPLGNYAIRSVDQFGFFIDVFVTVNQPGQLGCAFAGV